MVADMSAFRDSDPIVAKPLSLLQRAYLAVRLWAFKAFVVVGLGALRLAKSTHFRSIAPTYTKRYGEEPSLECRVFLPRSYKSGTRLPLYIDIHGGGFALCDPQTDDHFCRYFADSFEFCVVSINYRKAPLYPYPYPVDDCVRMARAVLADDDLPIDHTRVAMGGFSAGGNLSLAVAQFSGLKSQIKAIVPIYPVVNFTGQDRGEFKQTKDGKEDVLKNSSALINWAYISTGIDRREKTLSPLFATRDDLPQKIYFIGAEYDCLCHEASVMAKKLAGIQKDHDAGLQWQANGIRWETVPDVQHGFTHISLRGKKEEERTQICHAMYRRIAQWLEQDAF